MKSKYEVQLSDIRKIEEMTNKGKSDVDISKELQIKASVVGAFTRKYWAKKMKNKKV